MMKEAFLRPTREVSMSQVSTEQILVVPTATFRELGYFQGFTAEVDRYLPELLREEHTSFRPRPEMERDPGFKQLIPYCLFSYRDPEQGLLLFQYTRGQGQGERRLHAKRSVGIGGHISSEDDSPLHSASVYEEGMRRELEEEISIGGEYRERMVGLINDDETEVGRVHLGVVHLFELASPDITPREADIAEPCFRPVASILAEAERFETWSQICVKALFSAPAD